jgi:hypothetical protein
MFMLNPFVISSTLLCLCLAIVFNSSISPFAFSPLDSYTGLSGLLSHPKSLVNVNHGFPHVSSWSSWFHPQGSIEWQTQPEKKRNLLYHLGRTGPWIEMLDGVLAVKDGIGPPEGCAVDQVHMVDTPRALFLSSHLINFQISEVYISPLLGH